MQKEKAQGVPRLGRALVCACPVDGCLVVWVLRPVVYVRVAFGAVCGLVAGARLAHWFPLVRGGQQAREFWPVLLLWPVDGKVCPLESGWWSAHLWSAHFSSFCSGAPLKHWAFVLFEVSVCCCAICSLACFHPGIRFCRSSLYVLKDVSLQGGCMGLYGSRVAQLWLVPSLYLPNLGKHL